MQGKITGGYMGQSDSGSANFRVNTIYRKTQNWIWNVPFKTDKVGNKFHLNT